MPVLTRLIRNTPGLSLKPYFDHHNVHFSEPVNWNSDHSAILPPVLKAVNAMSESERERIRTNAGRVDGMSTEVGQTAILAVVTSAQREALRDIETLHARALWLFLNDADRFHYAEHAAFFDNARQGRTWDGFLAVPGLTVNRDEVHLSRLRHEVEKFFQEGKKVRVEVFDRTRPDADGNPHDLIQVTVYREGLPAGQTVFEADNLELGLLVYRPVCELAFSYEPQTGVIEVVAQQKVMRSALVKLFASTLLDQAIDGKRIPLRQFDLSVFMTARDFPTDPRDGIVDVRLRLVRFEHHDSRTFVTVEARNEDETIHAAAQRMFEGRDPFTVGDFDIREVVLAVRFRPDRFNARGKTVAVKLRHPNGCDLKDKTEKERMLGEKYLRRWGVLKEISLAP